MASQHLVEEVIPHFTQRLDTLVMLPYDSDSFTSAMHSAGINMRHLNLVATAAKLPHVRELCEVEMVARVCKHMLQTRLRGIIRRMLDFTLAASETAMADGSTKSGAATRHVAKSYVDAVECDHTVAAAALHVCHRGADALSCVCLGLVHVRVSNRYSLVLAKEMRIAVVEFFNLVLGFGNKSVAFWRDIVLPNVAAKFSGYAFAWTPRLLKMTAGGQSVTDSTSGGTVAFVLSFFFSFPFLFCFLFSLSF